MDLIVFEQDRPFIVNALTSGEFDYIEAANEIAEADFFRGMFARKVIEQLAASYPTPRQKEEVPLWLYVASEISLKLHGSQSHFSYPYIIRCGGLMEALGPTAGHKSVHPETGNLTLFCQGFNRKNHYDRETPCDQDFLRKLALDTDPDLLTAWFNREVPQCLKRLRMFDAEGIFIGDGSYLFVPDNEAYGNSDVLLFDDHNHPVDPQKVDRTDRRYHWERCYKMVSIIHTNRNLDYFLYVGLKLLPGRASESGSLYQLVAEFVRAVGRGVMKTLILDRGFIDGEAIGKCKQEHKVDVIIPLRKNMDLYQDVMGLSRGRDFVWQPYEKMQPVAVPQRLRPPAVAKREAARQQTLAARKGQNAAARSGPAQAALVSKKRSYIGCLKKAYTWQSCPVPLNAILNREVDADGMEDYWVLVSTRSTKASTEVRTLYGLRPATEERHRQVKCFWDLTKFRAQDFALVLNQVLFLALTYTLLQTHLYLRKQTELNRQTRPRLLQMLSPTLAVIIVYYQRRFARFSIPEYSQILLNVSGEAKKKLLARMKRMAEGMDVELLNPRPP